MSIVAETVQLRNEPHDHPEPYEVLFDQIEGTSILVEVPWPKHLSGFNGLMIVKLKQRASKYGVIYHVLWYGKMADRPNEYRADNRFATRLAKTKWPSFEQSFIVRRLDRSSKDMPPGTLLPLKPANLRALNDGPPDTHYIAFRPFADLGSALEAFRDQPKARLVARGGTSQVVDYLDILNPVQNVSNGAEVAARLLEDDVAFAAWLKSLDNKRLLGTQALVTEEIANRLTRQRGKG